MIPLQAFHCSTTSSNSHLKAHHASIQLDQPSFGKRMTDQLLSRRYITDTSHTGIPAVVLYSTNMSALESCPRELDACPGACANPDRHPARGKTTPKRHQASLYHPTKKITMCPVAPAAQNTAGTKATQFTKTRSSLLPAQMSHTASEQP